MLCYSLFRNDPQLVSVHAGIPLFVEGEPAGLMYILVSGQARVVVGGREVDRLRIGSVAGEMSLVSREPHSTTVEAVTNCEFACVDEKRFDFLATETPGFALKLMRIMAERHRSKDIGGRGEVT